MLRLTLVPEKFSIFSDVFFLEKLSFVEYPRFFSKIVQFARRLPPGLPRAEEIAFWESSYSKGEGGVAVFCDSCLDVEDDKDALKLPGEATPKLKERRGTAVKTRRKINVLPKLPNCKF